jgi:hypothetical protein
MPKRKWPAVTLAALLLLTLVVGLLHFAGLTTPDAYPSMSSLNSGPKGMKLLFDALSNMHPLSVSRNYLPFSQWHPSSTTVLMLGITPETFNSFEKDDLIQLERLAQHNNRIVLGVRDAGFIGKPDPKKPYPVKMRWGVQIVKGPKTDASASSPLLDNDSSWQPVPGMTYTIEKHFGNSGVIVIALHSDALSNGYIATNPTNLQEIPSMIGPNTSIVFEETHLGIEESGSIAALARRYKLQGLIAGLLLLVGLFIWNQSVSFPPPPPFETDRDSRVVGADARGMFAGLISRHLTPQALIESCIAEWNRVKPQQRITTELSRKTDPVATYRQLQESLHSKRNRI